MIKSPLKMHKFVTQFFERSFLFQRRKHSFAHSPESDASPATYRVLYRRQLWSYLAISLFRTSAVPSIEQLRLKRVFYDLQLEKLALEQLEVYEKSRLEVARWKLRRTTLHKLADSNIQRVNDQL